MILIVISHSATTSNQSYSAGYNASRSRHAALRNLMGSGYGYGYGQQQQQQPDDEEKPKEVIKLDPNDLQDIIMGDDLAENTQKDADNGGIRNRLKGLFGKNGKKKEEENENEDDDDSKLDDANKSERVMMGDDDRNIYNEFCKTMSVDTVRVISIQKIKDNAAKKMVYDALLTAKREELKEKKVEQIERNLFHGTSFGNIAKIVNNGFNRDFNRHHLYGKGTYFSSLASESAKYCTNDHQEDKEQLVMLVCRVIIGEYTVGNRDMDGASIPYKPDKKTQYESCVNNMESPTIFVINRDYHAMPTHIITFKYKK